MFHVINLTCGPSAAGVPSKERCRKGSKWSAARTDAMNRAATISLAHISGQYILSIEDRHSGKKQSEYISAADAAIVKEAVPGGNRLQYIAPEVHVGCEEIGPQVLKEFYPPDYVEHYVYGQRRDYCHGRAVEQDRKEHRDRADHQQGPGAGECGINEPPNSVALHNPAGFVDQVQRARIQLQVVISHQKIADEEVQPHKERDQQVGMQSDHCKLGQK